MLRLDGAGVGEVFVFTPAEWQVQPPRSSAFFRTLWDACDSDYEFEWPRRPAGIFVYLVRVLDDLTGRRLRLTERWTPEPAGDIEVWPFFRREDYHEALRLPRLLNGCA